MDSAKGAFSREQGELVLLAEKQVILSSFARANSLPIHIRGCPIFTDA